MQIRADDDNGNGVSLQRTRRSAEENERRRRGNDGLSPRRRDAKVITGVEPSFFASWRLGESSAVVVVLSARTRAICGSCPFSLLLSLPFLRLSLWPLCHKVSTSSFFERSLSLRGAKRRSNLAQDAGRRNGNGLFGRLLRFARNDAACVRAFQISCFGFGVCLTPLPKVARRGSALVARASRPCFAWARCPCHGWGRLLAVASRGKLGAPSHNGCDVSRPRLEAGFRGRRNPPARPMAGPVSVPQPARIPAGVAPESSLEPGGGRVSFISRAIAGEVPDSYHVPAAGHPGP